MTSLVWYSPRVEPSMKACSVEETVDRDRLSTPSTSTGQNKQDKEMEHGEPCVLCSLGHVMENNYFLKFNERKCVFYWTSPGSPFLF